MTTPNVAACSQVGVDYTKGERSNNRRGVAACSQVGVDYTPTRARSCSKCVAACSQVGVDYTQSAVRRCPVRLRLARRLGSITLGCHNCLYH